MRDRSFRLIDLFVVVAIAVALTVGVLGARRSAQENSVIVGCASRLSQLAQSLVLYQSLNDGQFPRTRFEPGRPLTFYTAPDAADPFGPQGPAANDVTASLFLLARTMDVPAETFTCPAAIRNNLAEPDMFDRDTVKNRSNFRGRLNDNYALANMYPDAAAVAAGYSLDHFRERLPANFAIAADTSPGREETRQATTQMSRMTLRMANSPNHERDGQNVMFADGSVTFFNSPFVGVGYDNVYTGRDAASLQPASAADSVMVPVWTDGPQDLSRATRNRRWVLGGSMVGTFLVLGYVVWHGTRKKTTRVT